MTMRIRPTSSIRALGWQAWAASLLLFALLCAVVAYWSVLLLAPRSPLAPSGSVVDSRALPELRQAASVFGLDGSAAPSAQAANIQVSGIVAAGARGSAILAVDGKPPKAYAVGEAIGPGQRVAAVRSDAVVIADGDAQIELPAPPAASIAVLTSGPNPNAPRADAPAQFAPAGTAPGVSPAAAPAGLPQFFPRPAAAPPAPAATVLQKQPDARPGN